MKLEDLLGEELYSQVKEKIDSANEGQEDKQKHIRFADLSEGGYISKGKYESLQADMNGSAEELKKANALIEEMKAAAGKDSELQGKITAYEAELESLKAENAKLKLENALKMALKDAGADDVEYLMFKAKEKDKIRLDEDGKIIGLNDLIADLQTLHRWKYCGGSLWNNFLPSGLLEE